MTHLFGLLVSVLSLIGLVAIATWAVKKMKGLVGVAIVLAITGFLGFALVNGLVSLQGVSWPVDLVPAVLSSIGVAWLVKQLFPSGSGGGHGHGAHGQGGNHRRVDWRAQVAGVIAGAAVLVGIWWGFLTNLPTTTTASFPAPAPATVTTPTPAASTAAADACAKLSPRGRKAAGCK